MGPAFSRKYATATHIYVPIIKRGAVDFAVGADWTPAAGDVNVSIDGGAVANIGTLPTAITSGNGAFWDFTIATGEVTGKKIMVVVSDAATKAVEDTAFLIETYGHASAEYQADLSAATAPQTADNNTKLADIQARLPAALTSGGNMKAGVQGFLDSVFTEGAAGRIAAAFKQFFNIATPAATMDHGVLVDTVTTATTATNLTNAPGAGDFTATMKTSLNASTPGVSAAGVQAIWDALTSALTTSGSIGKWILDKLDVVLSTRLATSGYTTPPTVGAIADQVWEEPLGDHTGVAGSTALALNAAGSAGDPWGTALPGAYGAGTAGKILGTNLNATVSSRAIAGDAMTLTSGERTTLAASIWNALTSGLTTVGSIGKLLVDNVNATISSRSSHLAADVWAVTTRVLTAGTNIVLAKGTGVTGFNDLSAAQVNTEADTALSDVGLTTTVTGRIDDAISTRLGASLNAQGEYFSYQAPPTAVAIADALLTRDFSAVSGEAARSMLNALRFSRNKWAIVGGVLTVYKENDSTVAWTAPVTTTAGDPVSGVDPA